MREKRRAARLRVPVRRWWRACCVRVEEGEIDRGGDAASQFDGRGKERDSSSEGQAAYRPATVVCLLCRVLVLLAGSAIGHVSGADNPICANRHGSHVSMGDASGEALQQKQQKRQHGDRASRASILHYPAHEPHES